MIGAHGGAGSTSVAALLNSKDPDTAVEPGGADAAKLAERDRVVVLVARSTAYGMAAAARRLTAWPSSTLPWLVVVADAPAPPPVAARFRVRALRPRTAGIAQVPYLFPLRAVDHAAEVLDATSVSRAAVQLLRALTT